MPLKANRATWRILQKLAEDLALSDEDFVTYHPQYVTSCTIHAEKVLVELTTTEYGVCATCGAPRNVTRWAWSNPTETRDIPVGDVAHTIIKNELTRLNDAGQLDRDMGGIFDKFVEG
jgi:hypothetical protein